MSSIGTKKKVLDQHGGGLNLLLDDTTLGDNEWRIQDNFDVLGNRLVVPFGYEQFFQFGNTNKPIQGISVFEDYIFSIQNSNLFIHNSITGTTYPDNTTGYNFGCSGGLNYNLVIGKFLDVVAIILCEQDGLDVTRIVEFNAISFALSTKSFTGYTGKATCGIFKDGQLLLGGTPGNPSTLYYSKPYDILKSTLANSIYKFDAYPAGYQVIGDASPIVGFNNGVNRLYVAKRNSIFQITGYDDQSLIASPTFKFLIEPITATGPLNQEVFRSVLQDTFYFDGNTVRRLSYEEATFNLKDTGISENIQTLLDVVPLEQTNATSFFSYPYYKLFLRDELSSVNNIGFVYNVINNVWTTRSGITILHASNGYRDRSTAYFGDVFNGKIYEDNVSYTHDGGAVDRYALSKNFDFGDRVGYKRIFQTELAGIMERGMDVYVDIIIDDEVVDTRLITESPNNITLPSTSGTGTIGAVTAGAFDRNNADVVEFDERYEHYYDGRTYALAFRTESIGQFQLHTRTVTYKSVKPYDIHY